MPEHPTLDVGQVDGALYLHVGAHASQQVCATARRLTDEYLRSADNPRVIIDLEGAKWSDSTFAGWLMGLRKRLPREASALRLSRCSATCRDSLDRMQLTSFFEFADVPPPEHVRRVVCIGHDKPYRPTLELMVAAHEDLAQVCPQNAAVFGPIAAALRTELQQA